MDSVATTCPIVRLATVGIPVVDQDRALAFYTGPLGFETRRDVLVPNGPRWIEVSPRGDAGTTIALIRASDEAPAGEAPAGEAPAGEAPAGVETGIRLVTHDADALRTDLAEHGFDVGAMLRWPGVPAMFVFRDPDGNSLEIIEEPSA